MHILLPSLAILIVAAVLYDVLITTLSQRGGGPLTNWWSTLLWRACLALRYRLQIHWPLEYAGPVILAGTFAVWYLLLLGAWVTLFACGSDALQIQETAAPTGIADIIYFVGTTFSTLGPGNIRPTGAPWTFLTAIGALIGSIIMTLSISYLVPILSAAAARHTLISKIACIGNDRAQIAQRISDPDTNDALASALERLSEMLISTSYQSHIYPVLDFFCSVRHEKSVSQKVMELFDGLVGGYWGTEAPRDPAWDLRMDMALCAIDCYIMNLTARLPRGVNQLPVTHEKFRSWLSIDADQSGFPVETWPLERVIDKRTRLVRIVHFEGGLARADDDGLHA